MRATSTNSGGDQPAATERLAAKAQLVSLRRYSLWFALGAIVAIAACPIAWQFDHSVSDFLRDWKMPGDLKKAVMLSEAFAHGAGVFFILLSVFVVAIGRRRVVLIAILITALSGIVSNGLKATVVRVRPHAAGLQVKSASELQPSELQPSELQASETPEASLVVEASFWDSRQRSFPSGHTATAWGLAIGLSLCFRRAWWIFAILATLASVQRLESGAHYPTDVFAGAAIAFAIAAALLAIPKIRQTLVEDQLGMLSSEPPRANAN